MTYSILGHDPETGELGVAVQSQSFNTGAAVAWARPGVGVVATQSFTDRRYGWRGLELMAAGMEPTRALAELIDDDPSPEFRQVALLDSRLRVAQWTGERCVEAAGHIAGAGWTAQANLVESARVWESMGEAFEAATGSLGQRLLAALDAAQAAGGDWRGRGGAGIVVVAAEGEPWERVLDLRVEDGDDSLEQLRQLVDRAEGYRRWNRASEGRAKLAAAAGLSQQQRLWSPILDALSAGDPDSARAHYRALLAVDSRWEAYARALDAHPQFESLAPLFQG